MIRTAINFVHLAHDCPCPYCFRCLTSGAILCSLAAYRVHGILLHRLSPEGLRGTAGLSIIALSVRA